MRVIFEQYGMVVRKIIDHKENLIGDVEFYILLTKEEKYNEIYDRNGALEFQKIELTYTGEIAYANGFTGDPALSKIHFTAFANPLIKEVSLTGGKVMIDAPFLRGHRVGTYIINDIILWSKQWPDAIVRQIMVSSVDARTDVEKKRRNQFYEQFGIRFKYYTSENLEGYSLPIKTIDMENTEAWKYNIKILKLPDFSLLLDKNKIKLPLESEADYYKKRIGI